MILIGIGGNLPSARYGPPREVLPVALAQLEASGILVVARSSWYRTEPVPASPQPWFVNAVASLKTDLNASGLLATLQAVEARFGRIRSKPNAARVLDLDLLDYGGQVAEIAPNWRHPVLRLTAKQLLSRLVAKEAVERLP